MMVTATMSVHLIGTAPVEIATQREGRKASFAVAISSARRVRVQSSASNAWNQNWNSSNPGNQNNNNKTNGNYVRAVRRPGVAS